MKKITKSIKRIIVLSVVALIVIVSANATSFVRPAWGCSRKDVVEATKDTMKHVCNTDEHYMHMESNSDHYRYKENDFKTYFDYNAFYDEDDLFRGWGCYHHKKFEQDAMDMYLDIATLLGEKYVSIENRYTRDEQMFFLDEPTDTIIKLSISNMTNGLRSYSYSAWVVSVLYMERTAYEEFLADRMNILNTLL